MLQVNELIGFGVSSGFEIVLFDSASSENSSTVTAPNNIIAGDLIILCDTSSHLNIDPSNDIPSGFTQISTDTVTSSFDHFRWTTSYKKASGTEGGTSITGLTDGPNSKLLLVFREKSRPFSTITINDKAIEASTASPSDQTINVSSALAPALAVAFYGRLISLTFSPTQDEEISSDEIDARWKVFNEATQNVTVGATNPAGASCLSSFYVTFTF